MKKVIKILITFFSFQRFFFFLNGLLNIVLKYLLPFSLIYIYIYIYICKYYSDYTTYQLMQCKMFHHLYPFKVIELNTTPVKKKN